MANLRWNDHRLFECSNAEASEIVHRSRLPVVVVGGICGGITAWCCWGYCGVVTCGGALEVGVPLLDTRVVAVAARVKLFRDGMNNNNKKRQKTEREKKERCIIFEILSIDTLNSTNWAEMWFMLMIDKCLPVCAVFGDGCGTAAGAGLIDDVVLGWARGDTAAPEFTFLPRALCNTRQIQMLAIQLSWKSVYISFAPLFLACYFRIGAVSWRKRKRNIYLKLIRRLEALSHLRNLWL